MSRIILGLMRITDLSMDELEKLIEGSINMGITTFDIADIYGRTKNETMLGDLLKKRPDLRKKMYIQTKVGIAYESKGYDSSYDYIVSHTKESLKRLGIDYIDSLLIHRPDIFMDNEEVASAINYLQTNNIIKDFGVSNFTESEIEYLKQTLNTPIKYNQLQLGIGNTDMIDQTMYANMPSKDVSKESDSLYFYLKKENITIQCWSPYQYNFFEGCIFDEDKYPTITSVLKEYAEKYNTSMCSIATAFLLKLNKTITVITGSTKLKNIKEAVDGESINLSKADWYEIYNKTGHKLP